MPLAQLPPVFNTFTLEYTTILHSPFTPEAFSTTDNYSCSFIGEVRYLVVLSEWLSLCSVPEQAVTIKYILIFQLYNN